MQTVGFMQKALAHFLQSEHSEHYTRTPSSMGHHLTNLKIYSLDSALSCENMPMQVVPDCYKLPIFWWSFNSNKRMW